MNHGIDLIPLYLLMSSLIHIKIPGAEHVLQANDAVITLLKMRPETVLHSRNHAVIRATIIQQVLILRCLVTIRIH